VNVLRKLAVFLSAVALVGVPGAAQGGDNAAVAINTRDGAAVFRFAFKIQRVAQEIVDESNAAVAFASCTDCQTIAIAIQVVLVMGDADVVAPTNLALAVNQQCTLCETLASAYQFVFSTGGAVQFTAVGNQELAQIRREFQQLRQEAEGLTLVEVTARIAGLVERLRVVLKEELVPAGPPEPAPPPPPEPTETETTTTPATTETTPTTTETAPTTTTTETTTTP
jgi:putative peptide zinc metalloprotease protein